MKIEIWNNFCEKDSMGKHRILHVQFRNGTRKNVNFRKHIEWEPSDESDYIYLIPDKRHPVNPEDYYWIRYPNTFSYEEQILFHKNNGSNYPIPDKNRDEYSIGGGRKELRMEGNRSSEWMIEITQVGNQFTASGPENVTIGDGNQISYFRILLDHIVQSLGIGRELD